MVQKKIAAFVARHFLFLLKSFLHHPGRNFRMQTQCKVVPPSRIFLVLGSSLFHVKQSRILIMLRLVNVLVHK